MPPLFDAHNHLQDDWLRPHLDRIARDLAAAGVAGAVVNGTCEADWPAVSALAARFPWVRPSYGLHPWDVGNASPSWRETLLRTLDANPHASVGEVGLDRWILERARPDDPRLAGLRRAPLDEQVAAFCWQLRVAAERNLPVTIHCLDAWGALAAALRQTPLPPRGFLLHAYGGSAAMAREFAALGAYFSFNGNFLPPSSTHPSDDKLLGGAAGDDAKRHLLRDTARARRYADVFATLPRDRLLVETDAPAMPLPAARRAYSLPDLADGTHVNHPASLAAAYAGLAEILHLPPAELVAQVAANFERFFGPEPATRGAHGPPFRMQA
jgi:TatD DNase family protein